MKQIDFQVWKQMDAQVWNSKPKAFVIFADLDGTFTPMDLQGKIEFVNIIKEIHEKGGVQVNEISFSCNT